MLKLYSNKSLTAKMICQIQLRMLSVHDDSPVDDPNGSKAAQKKMGSLFSKEELDQIFRPDLVQSLKQERKQKDAILQQKKQSSFNTATVKQKASPQEDFDSSLRKQIAQQRHKYDFKYIKKQFKSTEEADSGIYKSSKELSQYIKDPQIQNSADKLLNVWMNNQFSFIQEDPTLSFEILRRLARAIPLNRMEGGHKLASSFTYELRHREDPRFADRRMQSLLTSVFDSIDRASPQQTSQICKLTV